MGKGRHLIPLLTLSLALLGCGDDDESDDDLQNGRNLPPEETFEANKNYTATVAGQSDPIILTFPTPGVYQMVQAGVTQTGTLSGATRTDNSWSFNLTPDAGQDGAVSGVLRLDFTSPVSGLWTFTPKEGAAETGTFVETMSPSGEGDTGGPSPNPDEIPFLAGKTLQINYRSGGGETFQFTTDTNVSYEDGAETGTYTWDQAYRRVSVTLGNGWLYDISIPAGGNAATVVFKQNATDPGTTDTATYTLQ